MLTAVEDEPVEVAKGMGAAKGTRTCILCTTSSKGSEYSHFFLSKAMKRARINESHLYKRVQRKLMGGESKTAWGWRVYTEREDMRSAKNVAHDDAHTPHHRSDK